VSQAKNGWYGVRIKCVNGETYILPADCCFI